MAMPAARGLFHKAIMQSGFVTWRTPKISGMQTAAVLAELGLNRSEIDRLQTMPVDRLVRAADAALKKLGATIQNPAEQTSWAPTVDGAILPETPFDPVAPAISANVPLLIGNVGNESGMQVPGHPERESLTFDELKKKAAARYGDRSEKIVDAYRNAHPGAKPVVLWEQIIGPRSLSISKAETKTLLREAPAYLYWFTWQSPVLDGRLRAFHTCDFAFAFDNTDKCSHMTGGGVEPRELAAKMSNAWISFARNGDPNHSGIPKWPAFTIDMGETMIFDKQCEVKNDPDREERRILESNSPWDVRKAMPRF
jgi:para-nitrobenzyl esterase